MSAELLFECEAGHASSDGAAYGATNYRIVSSDPPWKVVRGFPMPGGGRLIHLNNVSGGVFGGDSLRLRGVLQPGAEVQLTTTGATRLYRPRAAAAEAVLRSEFHLQKDSLLEYLPDALIPYRDVRATQHTTFALDHGATLFAWDTVAPGRVAHGERFCFERLRLITEVMVAGVPTLLDRLLLEPSRWSMATPGRYGMSAGYLVTFLAVHAGAEPGRLRSLEASLQELLAQHSLPEQGDLWGVSTMPAHGVMVRGLVHSSLHLPALLHSLWCHSKRALSGRKATPPRKIY